MTTRKRHRWIDNRCLDCDMTRRLEHVDAKTGKQTTSGAVSRSIVYRYVSGAQVWWPGLGNKVPPCRRQPG